MKTQKDVQRAHDLLVGLILGEVQVSIAPEVLEKMKLAASVCCWVLEHDCNLSFPEWLEKLEQTALDAGYTFSDCSN